MPETSFVLQLLLVVYGERERRTSNFRELAPTVSSTARFTDTRKHAVSGWAYSTLAELYEFHACSYYNHQQYYR